MRKAVLTAAVWFALAPRAMAAETGQSLYNDNCAACHQRTGVGIKGAFPALTGGKLVTGPLPVLVATVLNGRGGMPAFKSDLTDAQMAMVLTYTRASWGNKASAVTTAQASQARVKAQATAKPKALLAH
ncbi:c-type cytochrome [Phenylobacterium sp.]|uniref:c-type cytochrome n=1 Tax=Phenylobacterium sp. TaxID=1871053 RepID=UPI0037CB3DF0